MGARRGRRLGTLLASVVVGVTAALPAAAAPAGPPGPDPDSDAPAEEQQAFPDGTFEIFPTAGPLGTVIQIFGYCGPRDAKDDPNTVQFRIYANNGGLLVEGPIESVDAPDQTLRPFATTLTVPGDDPPGHDNTIRITGNCDVGVHSSDPIGGKDFEVLDASRADWSFFVGPSLLALELQADRVLGDVLGSLGLLGVVFDQPSTSTTPTTSPGDVPIPAPSPDGGPKEEPPGITTTSTTRAEQPSPTTTSSRR